MPELDIDSLLAPLAGDAPCGVNLEYDPAFQRLQEAAAGKPERQYGATIIPAEPPDWVAVREQALALAARTRDLRVAVWLVRGAARVDGLVGAVQGLQLLRGLLARYWEPVHPVLEPDEGKDPTVRLNILAQLAHDVGLADLRAAALTRVRGAVTVRDLEIAFGRAEALVGEAVQTEAGITPAVAAAQAQTPELATAMAGGLDAVQGIVKLLETQLGAAQAPDLAPLAKLMQCVALAGRRALGEPPTPPESAGNAEPRAGAKGAARFTGAIESREDALRALQHASEWIERNEPSNPAPLLIRRAQRLMSKNFMEIIRDLVPEGLGQIEKLAGTSVE